MGYVRVWHDLMTLSPDTINLAGKPLYNSITGSLQSCPLKIKNQFSRHCCVLRQATIKRTSNWAKSLKAKSYKFLLRFV